MTRIFCVTLAVAALFAVGCANDPRSVCERSCEHQRRERCNGYTGDENCVATCANAQTQYDSTVADADRIGCRSEFDDAYGCGSGGDYCDNSRCNRQVNALVACITAYCTVNPGDRVCM